MNKHGQNLSPIAHTPQQQTRNQSMPMARHMNAYSKPLTELPSATMLSPELGLTIAKALIKQNPTMNCKNTIAQLTRVYQNFWERPQQHLM